MVKVLAFPAYKNKSSNPYNYLLYSGIEEHGVEVIEFSFKRCLSLNYDLVHVHWPELYLNSNYWLKAALYSVMLLFSLLIAKCCGKKIIWTIHNLKPHNIKYKMLNKLFWPCYLKLVNGVISLSKANEELFFNKFTFKQKIENAVIHHGLYKGYYENNISTDEAKKYLSIDTNKKVSLFIGQVKQYKNVERLVALFNEKELSDQILVIAGKFETKEYFNFVGDLAKSNPNIIIHNKFIPDSELQYYFNAADLCILPFKEIFNSGSALLAASFETQVLLPCSPNFVEYSKLIENNLITTYSAELDSVLIKEKLYSLNKEEDAQINKLTWGEIQKDLALFYGSTVHSLGN